MEVEARVIDPRLRSAGWTLVFRAGQDRIWSVDYKFEVHYEFLLLKTTSSKCTTNFYYGRLQSGLRIWKWTFFEATSGQVGSDGVLKWTTNLDYERLLMRLRRLVVRLQTDFWSGKGRKFRVHLKREIRPKRDIVDTSFHASCAFGHAPILGLAFSTSWELEVKDQIERLIDWMGRIAVWDGFMDSFVGCGRAWWSLPPTSVSSARFLIVVDVVVYGGCFMKVGSSKGGFDVGFRL